MAAHGGLNWLAFLFARVYWRSKAGRVERYLGRCLGRLDTMESLSETFSLDTLPPLRKHAHQLVGSAGLYGFRRASLLARELQNICDTALAGKPVTDADVRNYRALVHRLRKELTNKRRFFLRSEIVFLVKPGKQAAVIAPALLLTAATAAAGYGLFWVSAEAAARFMEAHGLPAAARADYQEAVREFLRLFYCAGGILIGGAAYWSWRVSLWAFGPMRRLERQLQAVLDGKETLTSIGVREEDAYYDLFRKVDEVMGRLKK